MGTDRKCFYRCDVINRSLAALLDAGSGSADFMVDWKQAIIFIIMSEQGQQFEGNVIYPHVVGKLCRTSGNMVLVAVTIGGNIADRRMIFSIPFCSVFYISCFLRLWNKQIKKRMDIP